VRKRNAADSVRPAIDSLDSSVDPRKGSAARAPRRIASRVAGGAFGAAAVASVPPVAWLVVAGVGAVVVLTVLLLVLLPWVWSKNPTRQRAAKEATRELRRWVKGD